MNRYLFIIFLSTVTCFINVLNAQVKAPSAKPKKEFKILCYNIHHAAPPSKPDSIDIDAIVRVIKEANADVITLQEVDSNTKRSNIDEAKVIAEKTGLHYRFFKAIDHDGGGYGLAILSRHPLQNAKLTPLPQQIKAENRILAQVTIDLGRGIKFVIANTHLDASKMHENRIVQMQRILKEFEDTSLPVILCGDLNSVAGSETINSLDTQFKRTCLENCPGTSPQINPRSTIDYIATKNLKWSLLEYKVIEETYASDHRPITATFSIHKQ